MTESLIPVVDSIPGPLGLLSVLLFATFILHLLLMNAVVGVAAITFTRKLRALMGAKRGRKPPDDGAGVSEVDIPVSTERGTLRARLEFTQDTLLPKGVALTVNLGIAPFLFMQCLYAQYIYVSSVLMAQWWLAVMLIVMLAYYGTYLNMSTGGLSDRSRTIALGLSLLLLLLNAFLFVNNMTLLQQPERWTAYAAEAGGSFLNFMDPQVPPRYLHVVLSCLAVGGLCLALPEEHALRAARAGNNGERERHERKKRAALSWFLWASVFQVPIGLWFFLALDKPQQQLFMGGSVTATALLAVSGLLLIAALYCAWTRRAYAAAAALLPVIVCMAGMRDMLRKSLLAPYYDVTPRPFEAGPVLLFAGCLAVSAVILYRLGKIYLRDKAEETALLPDAGDAAAAPPHPAGAPVPAYASAAGAAADDDRRDILLVLEIPSRYPPDDGEDDSSESDAGGDSI